MDCGFDAADRGREGVGGAKAYETAVDFDQPLGTRSDNPQSFVTSHQKEYSEFTSTAKILWTSRVSALFHELYRETDQSLNSALLPIHRTSSPTPITSSSNGSPITVCIALKMMTGKALAYLAAFMSDLRGVGVDPVSTSDMHCRKRKMYGKLSSFAFSISVSSTIKDARLTSS